jgi:hypothetical protein
MTDYDVVVAGDGPAALALADACAQLGLQVCAVGEGAPWTATYGTWVDEVPAFRDALAVTSAIDVAVTDRRIALSRSGIERHLGGSTRSCRHDVGCLGFLASVRHRRGLSRWALCLRYRAAFDRDCCEGYE